MAIAGSQLVATSAKGKRCILYLSIIANTSH